MTSSVKDSGSPLAKFNQSVLIVRNGIREVVSDFGIEHQSYEQIMQMGW